MIRLRKFDKLNWVTQEHQAAGETITRGLHVGKETKERWKTLGYHNSLKSAALSMLDREIAEGWTGKKLAETIEAAEQRVMRAVEEALECLKKENSENE